MKQYRFDDNGNELSPTYKSVSDVNEYVKALVEEEALLQDIYIVAEISNFKNHYATGHYYFTLKDEKSEIRAIMFRSYAQRVKFKPQDGMKVLVHARVGVYQQMGSYQLYVDSMQPDGLGDLYLAFEQLKQKLEKEGLFDEKYKKSLPKYPTSIGVVTSSTGAAIKDIVKVATARYPLVKIVLYPALVQGADAPHDIIRGVEYFNIMNEVDVIIVGRGGGSQEDLWAFNDEMLARAMFNSHIPVVSAVGHEIDFTICDFVADVRAATPSHAAELVTPDLSSIIFKINSFKERAVDALNDTVEEHKDRLEHLAGSKVFTRPLSILDIPKLKVSSLADNLLSSLEGVLKENKQRFIELNSKLVALNPMSVISRGYGAVFSENGKIVKSINDVNENENIKIEISDGAVNAKVVGLERKK